MLAVWCFGGKLSLFSKLKDSESTIGFDGKDVAVVVGCPPATMPAKSPQMGLQTTDAFESCDDEVESVGLSESKLKRGVKVGRLG